MIGLELPPGGAEDVVFLLGQAETAGEARRLAQFYTEAGRAQQALEDVETRWNHILDAVQVRTPDPALDLMLNRWLIYQALACRMWGRSGFYQSGGAFGFRDQLQDSMALVYGDEKQARAQILRATARQFEEGDVPASDAPYLRSQPAQNVPWEPKKTPTLAGGSRSNASKAATSASAVAGSTALRASGRSMITVVTGPLCST